MKLFQESSRDNCCGQEFAFDIAIWVAQSLKCARGSLFGELMNKLQYFLKLVQMTLQYPRHCHQRVKVSRCDQTKASFVSTFLYICTYGHSIELHSQSKYFV